MALRGIGTEAIFVCYAGLVARIRRYDEIALRKPTWKLISVETQLSSDARFANFATSLYTHIRSAHKSSDSAKEGYSHPRTLTSLFGKVLLPLFYKGPSRTPWKWFVQMQISY